MHVEDPSGHSWRVRRRWLPWRPRRRDIDAEDVFDTGFDGGMALDDLVLGLALVAIAVILLVVVPWLLIGAVLVVEVLVVLVLTPLAVVMRAIRARGWPIEVEKRSDDVWVRAHHERRRGWGPSRRRMDELRDEIRTGRYPGPRHLV